MTSDCGETMTTYGRTVVRSCNQIFRLDGLLLFCIIMGLRSASSAMTSYYRETMTSDYKETMTSGYRETMTSD